MRRRKEHSNAHTFTHTHTRSRTFTFCINGKQPGLWATWLLLKNTRCASELNIRLQATNIRKMLIPKAFTGQLEFGEWFFFFNFLVETHAASDNNFLTTFVVWSRETVQKSTRLLTLLKARTRLATPERTETDAFCIPSCKGRKETENQQKYV